MGLDNAAFSIFLGGCTSNSSYESFAACYQRVDIGYSNGRQVKDVVRRIASADLNIYKTMVAPHILQHVGIMPQANFNCYTKECAKFIAHFPNYRERVSKYGAVMDTIKFNKGVNMGMVT